MLRHQTDIEQKRFRTYFQFLNVNLSLVCGDPTICYNSVAWSLGLTNAWLWPGNELCDFDKLYAQFGYRRSRNGPIAVWGHSGNAVTHVSVFAKGKGWVSKCGADLRLLHSINEFAGDTYGKVLAYYSPEYNIDKRETGLYGPVTEITNKTLAEDIKKIKEDAALVPRRLVAEFEKLFENWRNGWFSGRLAANSNPETRSNCVEFFRLSKMGEKILPLVVLKLLDKENYMALLLYNRLQPDPALCVNTPVTDPLFFAGEQGKAIMAVNNYVSNKKLETIV